MGFHDFHDGGRWTDDVVWLATEPLEGVGGNYYVFGETEERDDAGFSVFRTLVSVLIYEL